MKAQKQSGLAPIVIILIIVGVLVVAGGIYWWQNQYGLFCAKAGQTLTTRLNLPKLPIIYKCNCCNGLSAISAAPEAKYEEINGKYVPPPGSGVICSDCGNGICEQWENKYSCSADCVKDETADWQTYRNEEYGFEFLFPPEWSVKENIFIEKPLKINDSVSVTSPAGMRVRIYPYGLPGFGLEDLDSFTSTTTINGIEIRKTYWGYDYKLDEPIFVIFDSIKDPIYKEFEFLIDKYVSKEELMVAEKILSTFKFIE